VQDLRRRVVPDVAVVRLHGRGVDRLREVVALQHERVVARAGDLLIDHRRHRHALPHPARARVRGGPDHLVPGETAEDHGVLERRELVPRVLRRAFNPHVAGCAVVRRRLGPGHCAIAHDTVVEADFALGRVVPREVLVDEQRHRLPEESRRLALRHEKDIAVEIRLRHAHSVAREVGGKNEPVRLQVRLETGEVDAREATICPRRVNEERVTLRRRPTRNVPCAEIPRERLLPCDLGDSVEPEARVPRRIDPTRRRRDAVVDQRGSGAWCHETNLDRDSGDQAGLQETPARYRETHDCTLLSRT
jgi:hypothetical protein